MVRLRLELLSLVLQQGTTSSVETYKQVTATGLSGSPDMQPLQTYIGAAVTFTGNANVDT